MSGKVAVARLGKNPDSFREALKQIGSIEDLNSPDRTVVIKVGVFNHKAQNHTFVARARDSLSDARVLSILRQQK